MPPAPAHRTRPQQLTALGLSLLLIAWLPISFALPAVASPVPGGPLAVGGPGFGISGAPIIWDNTAPIQYRVDPGPMAVNPSGTTVINNANGITRVNSMFATWSAVTTASLSISNAGTLLPSGAYTGGPVAGSNGLANYNALTASCDHGEQSPVVFDPNGALFSQLGLPSGVIGFAGPCAFDTASGHTRTGHVALNGVFQDGVSNSSDFELTANLFNQAITHEIGHFLGLDHSQINVDVLNQTPLSCNANEVAGLPIMFPFIFCQDRVTSGLPALSPDDTAWISRLYPVTAAASGKTPTSSAYGTISGTVFFSDGLTGAQGVNVIARSTANPSGVAFSAVSGYLFTGKLGQSVTCAISVSECNDAAASSFGSRDTRFVGTFDIPVTPGTYSIQAESINSNFTGGSSVGPLDIPIPMPGTAPSAQTVTISAGASVIANITLQNTPSRFDSFESSELILRDSLSPWLRRDQFLPGAVAR
jgi:hypothetical protein